MVRFRNWLSAINTRTATTTEMTRLTPMAMPATSSVAVSMAGSGTICGRVEMKSWKASCSSTATAKLVSSMVAPLAPRTGRKAMRSSSTALAITTRMASGAATRNGRP